LRHGSAASPAASHGLHLLALIASAVVTTIFAGLMASAAVAAPTTPPATPAALRAQADDLANRYFAALSRFQSLDGDITKNQQLVADLSARAKKAQAAVRARALVAYTTSGEHLSVLISGEDSLDANRRAELLDQVNAIDETVYTKLRSATHELHRQQRLLQESRRAQADVLAQLRQQGAAIDAKLAAANQEEQAAKAAAAAAAASAAASSQPTPAADTVSPPPTTAHQDPTPVQPTPPPNYTGTPGTSPHHDDPFLTCVRQRESGGNYAAVNASGPYLGAYQFLQATWNVTASHSGHTELVGVPANLASPYDQDEMAWALYQWQGAGPWGGSC
jgi:peptidoglycan hydrolase CwlO-like protein